jgi:hypothetical protein
MDLDYCVAKRRNVLISREKGRYVQLLIYSTMKILDFETWFKELCSDHIWYEPASMQHKEQTFRGIAYKVYVNGAADMDTFCNTPMKEHRRHVYNKVALLPGDKPKQPWYTAALQKEELVKEEEWKPASPEHVDKCVAEFDEMLRNAPMLNHYPRMPYKQQVEEGNWLPKKGDVYPTTSIDEYYVRQRHWLYIKMNYEPRTGKPLPDWIPEEEFNQQFES